MSDFEKMAAMIAATPSPVRAAPPEAEVYYAFLIQRKQDREPWATIFHDRERAERYEGRVSEVTSVHLPRSDGGQATGK